MTDIDDLYTEWLGVPRGPRPPDVYTLLGLQPCSDDSRLIERAVRSQIKKLRVFQAHPDQAKAKASRKMINQIARARTVLVDSAKKAAYDQRLSEILGLSAHATQQTVQTSFVPDSKESRSTRTARKSQSEARRALADPTEQSRPDAFAKLTHAHLSQWKLNDDEEVLLIAEACEYGLSIQEARRIVRGISAQIDLEHARHKLLIRGVIAVASVTVLVCLVIVIGHTVSNRSREQAAVRLVAGARICIESQDWECVRDRLDEAREIVRYLPEYEEVESEFIRARVASILLQAKDAVRAELWATARARLESAEQLLPASDQARNVRGQLSEKAIGRIHALLHDADRMLRDRNWQAASGGIQQANGVFVEAALAEQRFSIDFDGRIASIIETRLADWKRLVTEIEMHLAAKDFGSARKCVEEATRYHPKHANEINRRAEELTRQKAAYIDATATYKTMIEELIDRQEYDVALARLAVSSDIEDAERERLVERAERLWVSETKGIINRSLQTSIRNGGRFTKAAIARLYLQNPVFDPLHASLAARLESLHASPSREMVVITIKLLDGSVIRGETVKEGSSRIEIRCLTSEEPIIFSKQITKVSRHDIDAITEWRRLSELEYREQRCMELDAYFVEALRSKNHDSILENAGELVVECPGEGTQLFTKHAVEIEKAIRQLADACEICGGSGQGSCPECQGEGVVDQWIPCPSPACTGGTRNCPNCHGKLKVWCRTCKGGGSIRRSRWTGIGNKKKKEYYSVNCNRCNGGKRTCPACGGHNVRLACEECKGKGKTARKRRCKRCEDGRIPCLTCAGSGRRPAEEPSSFHEN